MSVDLEQLKRIHSIQTDVRAAEREVKGLNDERTDLLADVPEFQDLEDAKAAVKVAEGKLKIAVQGNHDLNRLEDKLGEAKWMLHDFREILSHHLWAYHEETGRDVIKDLDETVRKMEFKVKVGKPTLDQPRLPLGINRHLGERQPIPDDRRIERDVRK